MVANCGNYPIRALTTGSVMFFQVDLRKLLWPNLTVGWGTLQNLIQIGEYVWIRYLYFIWITGSAFSEPKVFSPGPKGSNAGYWSIFWYFLCHPLRHGDCSRIVEAQFHHRQLGREFTSKNSRGGVSFLVDEVIAIQSILHAFFGLVPWSLRTNAMIAQNSKAWMEWFVKESLCMIM